MTYKICVFAVLVGQYSFATAKNCNSDYFVGSFWVPEGDLPDKRPPKFRNLSFLTVFLRASEGFFLKTTTITLTFEDLGGC